MIVDDTESTSNTAARKFPEVRLWFRAFLLVKPTSAKSRKEYNRLWHKEKNIASPLIPETLDEAL